MQTMSILDQEHYTQVSKGMLTREERRKLLDAPFPSVNVYGGRSWSGTAVDPGHIDTRFRSYSNGEQFLMAILNDPWYPAEDE